VERALGKVRFARLIHSGARILGGPAVRAAFGGNLSLDPPARWRWEQCPDYEKGPLSRENGVAETSIGPELEGTFSMSSSHSLNRLVVGFDDDHSVANAGLVLPATLAERLGIEAVVDGLVDLGDRPGGHRPGRKVLTLVHALLAGAIASTTPTCSAPGRRARCSATG